MESLEENRFSLTPKQDAFDEEYLTDDDEECRLKVRDSCALRAKNVGSIEVIARALSLFGLHFWLIYAGRYSDVFLLDFLYLAYAWLVRTAACTAGSEKSTVSDERDQSEMDELGETADVDPAATVTAIFGVQHGARWTRAQCTTRSTAAPKKSKGRRLRGRRKVKDEKDGTRGQSGQSGEEETKRETEETDKQRNRKTDAKKENELGDTKEDPKTEESEAEEAREAEPPALPSVSFSDRFQRQLLNAGIMHINHSSLLELTTVSICSCFLAVVFLLHLRWLSSSSLGHFYNSEAIQVVKAYGLPDSIDRGLAISAEMLLMWLCFERLYDMSIWLHTATLSIKQRNAALRFLMEHQPPWAFSRDVNFQRNAASSASSASLQQATRYCEEVVRCSEFALELSDARWKIVVKPVEFLVSLTEVLLITALLLILLPLLQLLPALFGLQKDLGIDGLGPLGVGFLDPVVPLTLGLVMVSPTVHTLLQAHFANGEVQRQQSILRGRAELALSKSPLKQEEDVEYVQLRNRSREALSKALLKWSNGRALGVVEPIMILYFALLVLGLAAISRLNFIII